MKKKELWIRLILFTLFACVIPFGFIAFRYSIFSKVNNISLSGWGLVGILIVLIFVFYISKQVEKIKKWSMTKQIFLGMIKVIAPLLCLYFALNSIKENVDIFMQSLIVVILCECVAIPLNPIPKWQEINEVDFFQNIFSKKEEDK